MRDAVDEAISQHLRNHKAENVPGLFCLAQVLLGGLSERRQVRHDRHAPKSIGRFGKKSTPKSWRTSWRYSSTNRLAEDEENKMLTWREPWKQRKMREVWASGERLVSPQDRTLYSLLRPERLLELVFGYIVFDGGVKKIARYQQYFAVKATLAKVTQAREDNSREGGVIWHTTGSGKSLTMVMLAKALALEPSIKNPKIVLVNDPHRLGQTAQGDLQKLWRRAGAGDERQTLSSTSSTCPRQKSSRPSSTSLNGSPRRKPRTRARTSSCW